MSTFSTPTVTSTFYFNGTAAYNGTILRDLPIYAVHGGSNFSAGWSSGQMRSLGQLKSFAGQISGQVPVYLAMPKRFAEAHFPNGREFARLEVAAFEPVKGVGAVDGYMRGSSSSIVFQEVFVQKSDPIFQWNGLPAPPMVQKVHLERRLGVHAFAVLAVRLLVRQADLVTN